MTLDEKIALFFKEPTENETGMEHSVLHMARREIQDCFIGTLVREDDVVAQSQKEKHRLFATAMVIMAATDLLAKMFAGSDSNGGTGDRIKRFVERYMFVGSKDPKKLAEVFYYGCRNPMLHSFNTKNHKYRISVLSNGDMANGPIWTVKGQVDWYALSIEGLFNAFVKALRAYEAELKTDSDLQRRFEKMFTTYGSMPVWSATMNKASGAYGASSLNRATPK
jgi:hypothetical protein